VYSLLESGQLSPVVAEVFNLEAAPQAHVEVIEHKSGSMGNIVLATKT
jgi:NADPH:quinone reductase-like Zn-dependent oxidoreductase